MIDPSPTNRPIPSDQPSWRRRCHVYLGLMIALIAALAPVAGSGQEPTKLARIGWMSRGNSTATDADLEAFLRGMRELGYVEGQTFVLEPRYANGNDQVLPEQAAELERKGVDVIIAGPFVALQAAKQSTSRVPIIMTPSADPVETGIVSSLEMPGGRITGITEMMPELTPRRLSILKQINPTMTRVAILWRPGTLSDVAYKRMLQETQDTARLLGVRIQLVEARNAEDFDSAFAAMVDERAEGLIVLVNPTFSMQRSGIIERASRHNIPAIYEWKSFVQGGGLVSYGADTPDIYRRAAGLVDQILKGAKPGDLPVEKPRLTDIAVNLRTAKALGVAIPQSLVKLAVLVIE
jgi:putative tryptophan/tyrosine transport system substrate-binding protein